MAAFRACTGKIKVDVSSTLTEAATVTGWSEENAANEQSFTYIGNCDEQTIAGSPSTNVSIEGHYDPTDTASVELLNAGATVQVVIHPKGENPGDPENTYDGIVTSWSTGGSGGEVVTFNATVKANSVTRGTVT